MFIVLMINKEYKLRSSEMFARRRCAPTELRHIAESSYKRFAAMRRMADRLIISLPALNNPFYLRIRLVHARLRRSARRCLLSKGKYQRHFRSRSTAACAGAGVNVSSERSCAGYDGNFATN